MITKEEIEKDMSSVAIESIKELTFKTVNNFKRTGLMSTELCLIAIYILDEYSESAKSLIVNMIKLDEILAKADAMLKELGIQP